MLHDPNSEMIVRGVLFDLYGTLLDIVVDENDSALWDNLALYHKQRGSAIKGQDLFARFQNLANSSR
jgi:FMN phosphatase YigB (HAD superfamily)